MSNHMHICTVCEEEYQCDDETGAWAEYCPWAEYNSKVCPNCYSDEVLGAFDSGMRH